MISSLFAAIIAYPVHATRVKEALDTKSPRYLNTFFKTMDFLRRRDGVKGIYKGFGLWYVNNMAVLLAFKLF